MGCNYYAVKREPTIADALHIGKSSAGYKFLFHEVHKGRCDYDSSLSIHSYEDWRDYLKNNKDIVILDEYDREVSYEELFDLIKKKQKEKNRDTSAYARYIEGYWFSDHHFS